MRMLPLYHEGSLSEGSCASKHMFVLKTRIRLLPAPVDNNVGGGKGGGGGGDDGSTQLSAAWASDGHHMPSKHPEKQLQWIAL